MISCNNILDKSISAGIMAPGCSYSQPLQYKTPIYRHLDILKGRFQMKKLFLTLIFILASSNAWAAIYYVSTGGSDSYTNAQAQNVASPWRTINYAIKAAAAGDTIIVRGGTYYERVLVNKQLTLKAYTGEVPAIDGNTTWYYTASPAVFKQVQVNSSLPFIPNQINLSSSSAAASSASYYNALVEITAAKSLLDGFEVRNSPIGGIYAKANGVVVQNCTVRNVGEHGMLANGPWNAKPVAITFQDCEVTTHNQNHRWLGYTFPETKIGINGGGAIASQADGTIMRRLRVHDGWGEGIDVGRNTIGTIVEYCVSYDNSSGQIYTDWAGNATIRYNLAYTTSGSGANPEVLGINLEPTGSTESYLASLGCGNNFYVYGNILIGFVWLSATNGTYHLNNIRLYNNTFLETSVDGNGTQVMIRLEDNNVTNLIVNNNIFKQSSGTLISGRNVGEWDYNFWSPLPPTYFRGGHDKSGDPLFVGGIDFTSPPKAKVTGVEAALQSTSPAGSGALILGAPYNVGMDPAKTNFTRMPIVCSTLAASGGFGAFASAGGNPAPEPPPTPSEVIDNTGFENGTASWNFYTNGTGTFAASTSSPYAGAESGQVTINTLGSNSQLYQSGIILQPDTNYRLVFAAKCSAAHGITVSLLQDTSPYTSYGINAVPVTLSTDWAVYTIDFSTQGLSAPVYDGRLMFWFADTAERGDIYSFDEIQISAFQISAPKNFRLSSN